MALLVWVLLSLICWCSYSTFADFVSICMCFLLNWRNCSKHTSHPTILNPNILSLVKWESSFLYLLEKDIWFICFLYQPENFLFSFLSSRKLSFWLTWQISEVWSLTIVKENAGVEVHCLGCHRRFGPACHRQHQVCSVSSILIRHNQLIHTNMQ